MATVSSDRLFRKVPGWCLPELLRWMKEQRDVAIRARHAEGRDSGDPHMRGLCQELNGLVMDVRTEILLRREWGHG